MFYITPGQSLLRYGGAARWMTLERPECQRKIACEPSPHLPLPYLSRTKFGLTHSPGSSLPLSVMCFVKVERALDESEVTVSESNPHSFIN